MEQVFKSILRRIYYGFDAYLDRRDGVDTATALAKDEYATDFTNLEHAIQYLPADRSLLRRMFRNFPYRHADFTFIDIGCGKGRPLLAARKFGFHRIIGVELEPALTEAARRNIDAHLRKHRFQGSDISIVNLDIDAFTFPAGDLFLFMYNPFHETLMRRLIEKLENWIDENGANNRLIVGYMNPVHGYLFQASPKFREFKVERKLFSIYPADNYPLVLFENA